VTAVKRPRTPRRTTEPAAGAPLGIAYNLVAQPAESLQPEAACATVNAYLGHFNHAASRQLRTRVTGRISATPHLAARLEPNARHTKITLVKKSKKERTEEARLPEDKIKDEFAVGFSYDHNLGHWAHEPGLCFALTTAPRHTTAIIADRGRGIYKSLSSAHTEIKSASEALRLAFEKKSRVVFRSDAVMV